MAVPMTQSAAVSDFGGRRYHRFVPFNFLPSLAAPHLHGVLVPVTGNKFIAGVVDTGEQLIAVSLTPVTNIHSRISPRIFEKNRNGPKGILGAWETMIHEKNLKSKISCQTPFKSRRIFKLIHIFIQYVCV